MAIRICFNKFPTPTLRVAFWRYRPSTPTSRKPIDRSGDTSSSLSKTARSELITGLDKDLSLRHGKGFSRSNLVYMRLLYLRYPISQKPSHQLSWSHYVELLKLDDELERSFYEKQAIAERWSVPELKCQKAAALFLRLASGKNKSDILQLAQQGQITEQPTDLLCEPYVFEFLKIPEPYQVSETHFETVLCDHLQQFFPGTGQRLHLRWPTIPHHAGQHPLQGRSGLLPPHPALLRAHRPQDQRGATPRHRPDEYVSGLLCHRGKHRRRQLAHRHHPHQKQGRATGGVRYL